MSEIIRSIEKAQLRTDLPKFNIGDTIRVFVKVVEGSRERLQAFEGTVMAKRNGSVRETFTVRRVSYGIGVERTFPLHSPRVDHIEVIRRGKVRRAKLYYLRICRARLPRSRKPSACNSNAKPRAPETFWALFWYIFSMKLRNRRKHDEGLRCRSRQGIYSEESG